MLHKNFLVPRLSLLLALTFFFSTALSDTTYVSGTIIDQTWTPAGSPYCVVGDIVVAKLTVWSGVRVVFMGDYVFEVAGVLTAVGTARDSIIFSKADSGAGWRGMFFNHSTPGSELAFCIVKWSTNGGITIDHSFPIIRNTRIEHNSRSAGVGFYADGGGIYCNVPLVLRGCDISSNSISVVGSYDAMARGGGVFALDSLTIVKSIIRNNSIRTETTVSPPTRANSYGGGIYGAGVVSISNSIISDNRVFAYTWSPYSTSVGMGGGVFVDSSLRMTNSIVSYNEASASGNYMVVSGSGVHFDGGTSSLVNSTVVYNTKDGLNKGGGTASIRNSIIYFNTGDQIADTSISAAYSDVQKGYSGEGNIDFNPVFAGPADLRIVLGSRCIDTGDPNPRYNDVCFPPSLGTERNDMGAHGGPGACGWYDIPVFVQQRAAPVGRFMLDQNYPNPFNPNTIIKFELPKSSVVKLTVYDMLGREVSVLVNERKDPGVHEVKFDGSNLASGVYFYRLQAGDFGSTKKLLILR